jgi:hypothetical protein
MLQGALRIMHVDKAQREPGTLTTAVNQAHQPSQALPAAMWRHIHGLEEGDDESSWRKYDVVRREYAGGSSLEIRAVNSAFEDKSHDDLRILSGVGGIPSVIRQQELLENAWAKGFDPEGAQLFRSGVHGSQCRIGESDLSHV